RRRNEELEALVEARQRELLEAQAKVVRLEKAMTEQQVAGGVGHEMRNAPAGGKMLPGAAPGPPGGQSLAAQSSASVKDALRLLQESPRAGDRHTLVPLLTQANRNDLQVDGILREIDAALARAVAMTQMIMDYAKLGREQPGSAKVPL